MGTGCCQARSPQHNASRLGRAAAALLLSAALLLLCHASDAAADSRLDPLTQQRLDDWRAHVKQQWEAYYKHLESVTLAGGMSAKQALGVQPDQASFILPPSYLKRGIAYEGSMARVKRVLKKLQAGQRVKLGVIGGSISWGSAVPKGQDWFSLLVSQLQSSFPAANVTGRNGCVPATPSSFMEACLQNHMDEDTDLAFVEYATNDGWETGNLLKQRVYERLLRKVSKLPGQPAVVLVQLPTKGQAYSQDHPLKKHFHNTVEDVYGAFAAYYDLPALSMRNAVWSLSELHEHGLNWTSFYGTHDFLHPLEPGHRAVADMALWLLQHASLHAAMFPDPQATSSVQASGTAAAPEAGEQLPPPMFPGNYEGRSRLCVHGVDFGRLVTDAQGFEMINEGDDIKQKYGMVAMQPGAKLRFAVNTTRIDHPDAPHMDVQIAYLKSYAHMGKAVARCVSGCSCNKTEIEASHAVKTSTIFLARLFVTQADKCELEVEVMDTKRAENKFKVTGVMVSEYIGPDGIVFLNREEWMEHVNHGTVKPYEKLPASGRSASAPSSGGSPGSSGSSSGSAKAVAAAAAPSSSSISSTSGSGGSGVQSSTGPSGGSGGGSSSDSGSSPSSGMPPARLRRRHHHKRTHLHSP